MRRAGFRGALARTEDGEPVGTAYGLALGPDARWWDQLTEPVLDGIEAERVLLSVHPENEAASAAYRAWGYRKAGEALPGEGADLHDVMLPGLR